MSFRIPCTHGNPASLVGDIVMSDDGEKAKIIGHDPAPNEFIVERLDVLEAKENELPPETEKKEPEEEMEILDKAAKEAEVESDEEEVPAILQQVYDGDAATDEYLCANCNHVWTPKKLPPKQCPKCKVKG